MMIDSLQCLKSATKPFIRKTRKEYQGTITGAIVEMVRKEMLLHFKATPEEVRAKYSPRRQAHSAARTRPYVERHCTIGAVKKPEVAHTHDTKFYRGPKGPIGGDNNLEDANKEVQAYFDSGADAHYFKDKPKDYKKGSFGLIELEFADYFSIYFCQKYSPIGSTRSFWRCLNFVSPPKQKTPQSKRSKRCIKRTQRRP